MRVIAGQFRSRPLPATPEPGTRPTSDKLRETLFNVLTAGNPEVLEGSVWLDLFAGTGAVGIEALSRGAGHVTFVDNGKKAVRAIHQNLKSLGVTVGFDIVETDAARALRQLEQKDFRAEYVFVDPPYADRAAYADTMLSLAASTILEGQAIVIAEHDKRFDPGDAFGDLHRYRKLLQGDSGLSFYRRS